MRGARFPRLRSGVLVVVVALGAAVVLVASGAAIAAGTEGKIAWSPLDIWVSNPDGSALTRLTCFSAYYPQAALTG